MSAIKFSTYIALDIEKGVTLTTTKKTFLDEVDNYIKEHLYDLSKNNNNRAYEIRKGQKTEVLNLLREIIKGSDEDKQTTYANEIAKRLLAKEKAVQDKIKHLQKLQKGGLIVAYFEHETKEYVVLAKVHYIDVRLEDTFEKKKATPEKEHMLKTAIIELTNNSDFSQEAFLADSTKPVGKLAADFWWNSFLELTALRSDFENTNNAYLKIEKLLEKEFQGMDFVSSRNNLTAYMRSTETFIFDDAVERVLGDMSYDKYSKLSIDEKEEQKEKLGIKIKKLNISPTGEKIFDGNFSVDKKAIKARMKKDIRLDDAIVLKIDGAVASIKEKIKADKDADGEHIKIYSKIGYETFK